VIGPGLISGMAEEHKNKVFGMTQEGPPGRPPTPKMARKWSPKKTNPDLYKDFRTKSAQQGPGADLGPKNNPNLQKNEIGKARTPRSQKHILEIHAGFVLLLSPPTTPQECCTPGQTQQNPRSHSAPAET